MKNSSGLKLSREEQRDWQGNILGQRKLENGRFIVVGRERRRIKSRERGEYGQLKVR